MVAQLLDNAEAIKRAKVEITRLYREGDDAQRRYIVDGILEHLFEGSGVEEIFSEWPSDPELQTAFTEAHKWAVSLRKKRQLLTRVATQCIQQMRAYGIANARVKAPEIGIDSVEIEWHHDQVDAHLIIDCSHEFVAKVVSDGSAELRLAKYAADPTHWTPDEYAPWQQWVFLADE